MNSSLLTGPEMVAAAQAITKAGLAIKKIYDESRTIEFKRKPDKEPVCEADLISNQIIQQALKPLGHPILSEESADDLIRLKSSRVWIVDPLDGTNEFINKTGEYTIMIGLVESSRPIFGIIYNPTENILYYGARGEGSFVKKADLTARLKVSDKIDISEAKIYISRFHFGEAEKQAIRQLGIRNIVTCGSSKKICLIASGEGEVNINLSDKTKEWDICAADIILSEAGGKLTDRNGEDFIYNKKNPRNLNGYAASNGLMHQKIIERLKNIKK